MTLQARETNGWNGVKLAVKKPFFLPGKRGCQGFLGGAFPGGRPKGRLFGFRMFFRLLEAFFSGFQAVLSALSRLLFCFVLPPFPTFFSILSAPSFPRVLVRSFLPLFLALCRPLFPVRILPLAGGRPLKFSCECERMQITDNFRLFLPLFLFGCVKVETSWLILCL